MTHVGSTAVVGLGGKGIIDVLIAIPDWSKKSKAVSVLENVGFRHIHPEDNGRIFLSRIGQTTYGDTHLHLVGKGREQYREIISFRDYLRSNKDEAKRYNKLKLKWLKEA